MSIVLRSRCLPVVAMSTKAFALQMFSQESSGFNKYHVALFFNESLKSKFTLNEVKIFNFLLHNIVKRLGMLMKKLSKFGRNDPFFSQLYLSCGFPLSDGPTIEIKTRFFVEINLFIFLVRVKCILPHCTRSNPNS